MKTYRENDVEESDPVYLIATELIFVHVFFAVQPSPGMAQSPSTSWQPANQNPALCRCEYNSTNNINLNKSRLIVTINMLDRI